MKTKENSMGTQPLSKLLFSLAVPAIIANLVNSLYNIVDQIFIGHGVGYLGNGATSVAFPLTTVCMAFGLMCGLGGSANFNIALGRKEPDKARKIAGTAVSMVLTFGVTLCVITNLFLEPLLKDAFIPDIQTVSIIISVGISSFIFQSSTMVIQIVTNNMLRYYGEISVYGSDVAIAVAGIVTKINAIFIAVAIGIVQGAQPIIGYNYGN